MSCVIIQQRVFNGRGQLGAATGPRLDDAFGLQHVIVLSCATLFLDTLLSHLRMMISAPQRF